ncbi:unnamed protein product [Larinioides sclopetarius]|uniref:Protein UBASH3A-like protein n=1 Tax=Larinioides sclopetarius TaxID=280406 RepID=A0AAV2AI49_9ARAC
MGDMTCLRKLFIMRHAERVDFTFGAWIPSCFDKEGNYIRKNLNMPLSVPKRKGGPLDFFKDCPLTRVGLLQATLTASEQTHLPINIEPGLFEWLSWYRDGMPKWMSVEELKNYGFNVSMDYEPILAPLDLMNIKESSEEYYNRNFLVTTKLLEKYPGNIFFVAHAASLDTCSRQLTGKPPKKEQDFLSVVPKATYASVALVEQQADGIWHLAEPPFPPLTHTNNVSFDWRTLLE